MRLSVFILIIAIYGQSFAAPAPLCEKIFATPRASQRLDIEDVSDRDFEKMLQAEHDSWTPVKKPFYFQTKVGKLKIDAHIGSASSQVYIDSTRRYVVKVLPEISKFHARYEELSTKFLASLGYRVPEIYDVIDGGDNGVATVREYIPSISLDTLRDFYGEKIVEQWHRSIKKHPKLYANALQTSQQITDLYREGEFLAWLRKNGWKGPQTNYLGQLVMKGDATLNNLHYTPTSGWFVIDP